VDVYAAALNFRDVMIALSLLPEKSYEGACVLRLRLPWVVWVWISTLCSHIPPAQKTTASFYGKNLGLEGAGVVTAVGKDVTNLKVRPSFPVT